ncbi:unnamed protein product, partial [Mesorhabditis spiculigera]
MSYAAVRTHLPANYLSTRPYARTSTMLLKIDWVVCHNILASASALKPPYHYEPGAVDIGRLTKEEWASVQGDLFRYEGALERWRIANGSGGTIEPQQGPQLQESVQTWIDASSKECVI